MNPRRGIAQGGLLDHFIAGNGKIYSFLDFGHFYQGMIGHQRIPNEPETGMTVLMEVSWGDGYVGGSHPFYKF